MSLSKFEGTWKLTGFAKTESELQDDPKAELNWLTGKGAGSPAQVSGLTMQIDENGAMTEEGSADVEWYDVEGMQESAAEPFEAAIELAPSGVAYVIPEEGDAFDSLPPAVLRCDDGDTRICEFLEVSGGQLTRTVNVVADETSLIRLVYTYTK